MVCCELGVVGVNMVWGEEVGCVYAFVGEGFLVVSEVVCAAELLAVGFCFLEVSAGEVEVELVGHVVDFGHDGVGVAAASDDAESEFHLC